MTAPTLADVQALLAPRGQELLAQMPPYEESAALRVAQRLRSAGFEPELVAAAMTQARLRARAREKLGDRAGRLLLTPDGVEQATRPRLAALHAARFVAAGVPGVWDLGCGIGSDAAAFADAGLAVDAVEADAATALMAAHNLELPISQAAMDEGVFRSADGRLTVRRARAEEVRLGDAADARGDFGVWFDPARRLPGRTDASGRTRRTFRLDQLAPSWDFVVASAGSGRAVGAKLSPGFPHAAVPPGAQAQWVSLEGEVLECALWFGPLAGTPGRTALVLRSDAAWEVTGAHGPAPAPGSVPAAAGQWLYDPDRAVVRAGRVDALAAATDGAELASGAGYVVATRAVDVPWARRYRIEEVLPGSPKPVRAALRSRGIDRVTIKKRGGTVDPDVFRAALRLPAKATGEEGVLVLTRTPRGSATLLVRPAPPAAPPAAPTTRR
ncbi:hypothetical protein BJY21_002942 [Kineosphaera limosa]|uniref:THUMP-like domain-containing protein n=1 Tax=Kineosphaera limosa NBRC 100340 TaxID=1184609 RepID=K6XCB5_9MICO|nr:hypothetical protein [Kineosphaera limosa]NYE01758.1 hypothetical protein [Kineosphaera limosa]GAB96444.1 hypothetical protein KILIM_039_00180 [Kineosphaera limosa NBRC 100340]